MFSGETWWVTGASSGIGEGLAVELAKRGARLILSGRNRAALEAVAAQCGDALVLPFEATNYAAIPTITEQAWNWAGRVDALVNNAGISQRSLAMETDFSVYEHMIAVDLLGPIALTQSNLPRMVSAGGGRIVAISSVAGIVGSPLRSAYSAAKHGLIGYHDSVRCETSHLGMNVHVIAPGSIKTNVSRNALTSDGSARGETDDAIENGLPKEAGAVAMLDGIAAGKRELIIAQGLEAEIAALRRSDPEALFDKMSAMVARGYAQRLGAERK